MPEDSIGSEIRQARAQLLDAAGGSLEGLVRMLQTREQQAGRRPVDLASEAVTDTSRPHAPPT